METRMRCDLVGSNGWYESTPRTFRTLSRWMKVKHNYSPSKRNPLWDYVSDGSGYKPYQEKFDPKDGLFLDYFTFKGRNYAIEQFLALGNPFFTGVTYSYEDKDGRRYYLSGVDGEDIFRPIYIECDEYLENVRVWEELPE